MKKTFKIGLLLTSALFLSAGFMSCSSGEDDDSPVGDVTKTKSGVTVVEADLASTTSMDLENYSHKVVFSVPAASGENWTASLNFDPTDVITISDSEVEGVTASDVYELGYLKGSKGTGPGSLTLYVYENEDSSTHSATLKVTYDGATAAKTVELNQIAASSNAGAEENPRQKQFIGYGYNVRQGYASTKARKKEIFNTTALVDNGIEIEDENGDTETVRIEFTDDGNSVTYREATGSNVAELESSLNATVNGTLEFNWGGFSSELESHTEWTHKNNSNYQYAWTDINLDAWTAILNASAATRARKAIMRPSAYNAINGKSPYYPSTNAGFKQLVKDYGTHVVVGGKLGGKVNITMEANTENMEGTFDAGCMIKVNFSELFGGNATLESTVDSSYKKTLKNEKNKFTFSGSTRGGNKENALDITALITNREGTAGGNADTFVGWQKSFTASDDSVFIDFNNIGDDLVPLYELIDFNGDVDMDAAQARKDAMKAYFESEQFLKDFPVVKQSSYVTVAPTKITIPTFDESDSNASLIKNITTSSGGSIVAVACSEFIPELNSVNRVTVVYPAVNNEIFWNMGVFPGDADHNYTPYSVGWDGSTAILSKRTIVNSDDDDTENSTATPITELYVNETALSTLVPDYLSDTVKSNIKEAVTAERKVDFGGNGTYSLVKIQNNIYIRDYYKGTVFTDGTSYDGQGHEDAKVLVDSYKIRSGSDETGSLPNGIHYYPSYVYSNKAGHTFAPDGWELPYDTEVKALIDSLNSIQNKSGTVAGMFMKDGVLGLNLEKTGYVSYKDESMALPWWSHEDVDSSIFATYAANESGALYTEYVYWYATRTMVSVNSGSVTNVTKNLTFHYNGYSWGDSSILYSPRGPCMPVILRQKCE